MEIALRRQLRAGSLSFYVNYFAWASFTSLSVTLYENWSK
jgi:hypothetical protein